MEEDEGNDVGAPLPRPEARRANHGDAIPEIRPSREVGWIFNDGDALAIERQGDRARETTQRFLHLNDG
jgi:hypothetical protein